MGLLTYRQTKKTKEQVRGLRDDLRERAVSERQAATARELPERAARRAELNRRREELITELRAHGFGFWKNLSRSSVPRTAADAVAERAAYRYVVEDGLSIKDAASRAAADRDAAAAM